MPFKSEKQRKYLWANEPEIARDWTDTYGSGIQKAKGGRIGFQTGKGPAGGASAGGDYGGNRSGGYSDRERGQRQSFVGAPPGMNTAPTHIRTQPKKTIKQHFGDGLHNIRKKSIENYLDRNQFRQMQNLGLINNPGRWSLINNLISGVTGKVPEWAEGWSADELIALTGTGPYAGATNAPTGKQLEKGADRLRVTEDFRGTLDEPNLQTRFNETFPGPKVDTGGGEGGQIPWWLRQQAPVASAEETPVADTSLGSGHFRVPEEYRLAEGGIIGSLGGTSRQKYQGGEIVGAEMEGAEMEGAMMQSQEVIKELYDALIAQGLSPQEAIEKIREMIAASQAEEPQSPMMGEEFPGQEFSRTPAAFGGIMDTYTGRRKYLFGSFNPFKAVKKGVSKLKKLASSKLGKIALGYLATAGFANIMQPGAAQWGSPLGKGSGWLRPSQVLKNLGSAWTGSTVGADQGLTTDVIHNKSLWDKGVAALKNPLVTIPAAATAAGLMTAKMPVEELDDVQGEWDEDKEAFDKYLASLDTGDSYRVPSQYTLAQGGRIGYGLGSWVKGALGLGKKEGSAEAHPGVVSTQDPDVMREKLLDYFKAKYSRAHGGRIGRQEGGLMNLGGMEKDYRNDGGFVPIGGEEKADDVPARLSRNEFVFTADAVRNAGGGDIDKGAEVMENVMKNLEAGGKVSEESQGQGAQEMFEVSERLSEVI